MSKLGSLFINAIVKRKGAHLERELDRQLVDLAKSQQELLLKIIQDNSNTDFGLEHSFSEIRSVEDFQEKVPVLDYEKLRPYIEKQDQTGKPVLLSKNPSFYAVTSGTTGKPKFIPVHDNALKAHKSCTNLFISNLLKERPKMFEGKVLAIVSPAIEGYMEASGLPFGSTSGHMYEGMSPIVRRKYIVPAAVFAVEDYDLKYQTILRLALQERNITFLSTANPSTIAKLLSLIPQHIDQMIEDIERGSYSEMDRLDHRSQSAMVEHLKPQPKRAEELRRLKSENAKIRIRDLWPNLQAIGTWMGGSSSIFLEQLSGQFPEKALLRDLGYLSSEFRGSVPIQSGTNAGVPTFWNGFYEFAEQGEWDDGKKNFFGLHQLQDKKNYYIFITTDYGLYRYNMNDIVQVDGFYKTAPMIRFIQKGKGVTSITGEKLYESQVIQAVSVLEKEMGVDSEFYMMSCSPEEARYTLYYELSPKVKDCKIQAEGASSLEACQLFQMRLDEILGEINIEYHAKRKSGRVHPLRLVILKRGTYETFKRYFLSQGQREGQFKIVALQFAKDVKFDFSHHEGWNGTKTDEENKQTLSGTRHASQIGAEVTPSTAPVNKLSSESSDDSILRI